MTHTETNAPAAAAYYDDANVADFYRLCWGGSDIHIGRYDSGDETVADASAAMTRHLLDCARVGPGDRVLDIACGYGGTLRQLAERGCRPFGIDISAVCVEEARKLNRAAGLDDRVTVEIGDFHGIDSKTGAWDAVICQESLIHSTDRPRVFAEVFRVLRPGGVFAFSDILTSEGADIAMVDAAFARLRARGGATPRDYRRMAVATGFELTHTEERPEDIATHYAKLAALLARRPDGLDPDAAGRIAESISRWQSALSGGHITWACFIARKPE
ncbi:MAG: methyltransferase domain-containing protein [Rhodobacter sp.]|nr:methyltransferase domain-containing protein [Rhodobacter sp.]